MDYMTYCRCSQVNRTAAALVDWFTQQTNHIQTIYYPNQPQPARPGAQNMGVEASEVKDDGQLGGTQILGMKDAKSYHAVMRGRLPLEAVRGAFSILF